MTFLERNWTKKRRRKNSGTEKLPYFPPFPRAFVGRIFLAFYFSIILYRERETDLEEGHSGCACVHVCAVLQSQSRWSGNFFAGAGAEVFFDPAPGM
jgi:hypothetical protein